MANKLIGNRAFYKQVLALTIPIMVQNGITNFVNMLDNVMVGRLGTVEMTGVAVANQLIFVFNLCIFGAVSGAGIFTAQFFGNGDHKGVRDTFRFKLVICLLLSLAAIAVFYTGGRQLSQLYLNGDGSAENAAASLDCAYEYLTVMLIGLVPYALVQAYSSTLRETGKAVPPMVAGLIAVGVNLVFNYILIFGHFGAPRLGVVGAAVATVFSRFVELAIVIVWTRRHSDINEFIVGAFRSFRVPLSLVGQIAKKGLPLMMNETFWAAGIAFVNQCYSVLGLEVVAANNINQTFWNVFSVAFTSVGAAIGIILGQALGAGDNKKAREDSYRLVVFSAFVSAVVALVFIPLAEFIPLIYNTSDEIRLTATRLMQISALVMPIDALAHASYFTLRSGGKTLVTFLFDSCFVWVVSVPAALFLSRCTSLSILPVYGISQALNLIKCTVGILLVRTDIWIKNIVTEDKK